MNPVRVRDGTFEVEASYLAEHFRIRAADVGAMIRDERIKARCERGEKEDAGCYRLSFRFGAARLSLVIDQSGNILRRMSVRWPERS
ncbi:MAG: DUF6522 family protein [Rhizobiaceae bacterium]